MGCGCRLCGELTENLSIQVGGRSYSRCERCRCIQMDQQYLPNPELEKKRYLHHQNNSDDYRSYLSGRVEIFKTHLKDVFLHLDYGSGPNPILTEIFEKKEIESYSYDPIFNPNSDLLNKRYDLITLIEVAEHFHQPLKEFLKLGNMIKERGKIVIMTQLIPLDLLDYSEWWYMRDMTHTFFYSIESVAVLGDILDMQTELLGNKGFVLIG